MNIVQQSLIVFNYESKFICCFVFRFRYIMTSQVQCLRRHELDAFLATAFATDLMNPLPLQEMTVSFDLFSFEGC